MSGFPSLPHGDVSALSGEAGARLLCTTLNWGSWTCFSVQERGTPIFQRRGQTPALVEFLPQTPSSEETFLDH